jgi:hypothetical protein
MYTRVGAWVHKAENSFVCTLFISLTETFFIFFLRILTVKSPGLVGCLSLGKILWQHRWHKCNFLFVKGKMVRLSLCLIN